MKKICALLFFCICTFHGFSQSPFGESRKFATNSFNSRSRPPQCNHCRKNHYNGCTPTTPPTQVPLDGGLSVLLVAGVAYGARIRRNRAKARQ